MARVGSCWTGTRAILLASNLFRRNVAVDAVADRVAHHLRHHGDSSCGDLLLQEFAMLVAHLEAVALEEQHVDAFTLKQLCFVKGFAARDVFDLLTERS